MPHRMSARASVNRRAAGVSGLVAVSLLMSGCVVNDSLADQTQAGEGENYIAGDGSVTEYDSESRGEPMDLSAGLYDGTIVNSADWLGQVTVLNVWYAACAPCRVEAPDLQALSTKYQDQGVQFYGVNIRDEAATAGAFERSFGITYPSIEDKDGQTLLTLAEYVPPQSVPSTLILDKQGRVAGRIIGLAEKSTLDALIKDTVAEQ